MCRKDVAFRSRIVVGIFGVVFVRVDSHWLLHTKPSANHEYCSEGVRDSRLLFSIWESGIFVVTDHEIGRESCRSRRPVAACGSPVGATFTTCKWARLFWVWCWLVPDWMGRIREEFGNLVPATPEKAKSLEALRQNLAAREGWVPLKHFESHQDEIEELVALEMISIREIMTEWHLHVTLQGTVNRSEST